MDEVPEDCLTTGAMDGVLWMGSAALARRGGLLGAGLAASAGWADGGRAGAAATVPARCRPDDCGAPWEGGACCGGADFAGMTGGRPGLLAAGDDCITLAARAKVGLLANCCCCDILFGMDDEGGCG